MTEIASRRTAATITGPDGSAMGEARLWAAGTPGPDGAWSGWLYAADAGGQLPPGRYSLNGDGWIAAIDIPARPLSRVFETDLQLFTGVDGLPWTAATVPVTAPPATGTPWQAAGEPPAVKHPGTNDA